MSNLTVSIIFSPLAVREVAFERAESAAVVVNAMAGLFIVAAISLQWLSLFTGSLVALLTILFGPLAGFTVSSLYSRVEWTVGNRLGGKSTHDELYRLFAWSFLPIGFAALLYALILFTLEKSSTVIELVAAIPSLVIFCCAIRNYYANVIAIQQFSRVRACICFVVTLVLFLILIAGSGGYLYLFSEYGMQDCQKSFLALP
jgi:hypothetical protein